MKIGMIHFRVGETDGVSLEMDKWKLTFEKMGHEVCYIAGESGLDDTHIIPEMSIRSAEHKQFFTNCYEKLSDYENEQQLKEAICTY